MAKRIERIEDLIPDPANANKGTERGAYMVSQSLAQLGAGRSIVTDQNGQVIAGNKTLQAAVDLGIPVKVVQTDGKELVVVQRTDLDLNDQTGRARQLAYADNRAGEVGLAWDAEQLLSDIEAGLKLDDFFRGDELDALLATVQIPDVEFKEYDESIADDVEYITCPHCGQQFPK